ncbi:MAG: histidine kinase dimerization/phospho-acceptor domain-containing protein, partial [Pseudomonadota bacterium]|nr:histidine kinase dimerization/phospho-acceptor domain-containing protein [Pseudomonadota bacterium]
ANAVNYLKTGLALLPNHSWHNHHALTLALHIEYLEAAYLNAEFEQLEALADLVIQQAQSTLEVIRVYELKMLYHLSQNQGVKALEQGLAVLAQLNITLDSQCVDIDVLQFTQLPEMKDVNSLAALHILMIMAPAAYINRPQLVSPLVSTMVNLCIRQGNTVLAAYGYAIYGLQLCGHKEDIEVGYQAAQLALKVLEQFPSKALHAKVYQIIYCHIQPWKHHLETTLTPLQQAIQTALEQGDLHYVGYSAMLYCDHLFFLGEPLTTVHQKQSFYLEMLHTLKLQFQCDYLSLGQHSVSNLLSATPSCELTQTEESVLLTAFTQAQNIPLLYIFHLHKCILHYLFNHYTAAIQHAQAAQDYQAGGFGLVHSAELNFYYSLALLAATQQTHQRKRYVHQVKKNQVEMLCWAFHSPMNFQHKYDLIAAELARLDARIPEAMALYDQAIEAANTQGYIQETAIAHELAARFYFELERHKIANLYLIEAYQAYLTWGAYAKVKDLEKQYPFLLAQLPTHATTLAEHTMTLSHAKEQLDLNSVIKASQTISSEIVFEQLLKKLMYIILEHSGAEQAWLLLRKDMQWGIEAYANLEETQILNALALESVDRHSLLWLSKAIVTYVVRTQVPLVLADASHHHLFAHDAYILERQPKSILAMPIIHKDELIGIIYLENNLMAGAFSATRLAVLKLLTVQIAISLENARFYTQLKQVQRHAEQARYEAEAANRAKTSFLANMSHELRTPLNAILGYSDLIQEEAQDLDYQEILTDLDKIQTASRQLLGIISDILNISKIEAEKLELNLFEFNVAHVIDEVVTTVQPLIKNKDNVLVIEYTNELGTIYADR